MIDIDKCVDANEAEAYGAAFHIFTEHMKNAEYDKLVYYLSKPDRMKTEATMLSAASGSTWPWKDAAETIQQETYARLCLDALILAKKQEKK